MSHARERSISKPAQCALLATTMAAGALAIGGPAATAAPTATPAVSVTGGAVSAYQNNAGIVETVTPNGINHYSGLGMTFGSSPSIAVGRGCKYQVVFQANTSTGALWELNSAIKGFAQHASVVPGTSPSVSYQPYAGKLFLAAVAWEDDDPQTYLRYTINLPVNDRQQSWTTDTTLGMMPGSSPAITALPTSGDVGDFEIAIQVANHSLYTVNDDGFRTTGQVVPGAELRHGTSPSISAFVSPS